jgi:hypothetical protein
MRAREHQQRFAARRRKERRTTFRGVWRKITYSIADDNLYNAKHTVLCNSTYIRLQPAKTAYNILSSGGAANNYLIECNYKFISRQVSAGRSAAHMFV